MDFETEYATRTPEGTIAILNQAFELGRTSKADQEELLKKYSLRPHFVGTLISHLFQVLTNIF